MRSQPTTGSSPKAGRVWLVGAGPGDPDLITLKALRVLERADVVVYDALIGTELLQHAPPCARLYDVGKRGHLEPRVSQLEIDALLIDEALRGQQVVRLKGGDPFVFGRGGEEASACESAGVPVEIIPGVSSVLAAPASVGIPITDRRYAASAAFVTGHRDPGKLRVDVKRVAAAVDTLVVLMGMARLEEILSDVASVRGLCTPATAVMWAATKEQRSVRGTLENLAARVRDAGLAAPSVIIIGDVVKLGR